jgi:hypothetical protein
MVNRRIGFCFVRRSAPGLVLQSGLREAACTFGDYAVDGPFVHIGCILNYLNAKN